MCAFGSAQLILLLKEKKAHSIERKSAKLPLYEKLCILWLHMIFFPLVSSPMKQEAGSFSAFG